MRRIALRSSSYVVVAAVSAFASVWTAGCNYGFDRDVELKPGDIAGRAVRIDENGKPAPAAQVVSLGDGVGRRTSADGRFVIRGLPPGTFSLRVLDDANRDGWPERTGSAAAVVEPGVTSLSFVDLGDVSLAGSMSIDGQALVDGKPPVSVGRLVRVYAVRDACFDVDAAHPGSNKDAACSDQSPAHFILGAEAETGVDSAGNFRFEQVGSGSVAVVAVLYALTSTGALGDLLAVSEPVIENGVAGDDVKLAAPIAFVENPPPPDARPVEIQIAPGLAQNDVVVLVPAGSGATTCDAAKANPAALTQTVDAATTSVVVALPEGPYDIVACHGGATGLLVDQVATPPTGASDDVLVWGPIVLVDGGVCATVNDAKGVAHTDCNGDGVPGLPPLDRTDPQTVALWQECLAACVDASARCVDATLGTFDCDDDGDGQPDPQEPACYGPGLGTDLDEDGLCSPVDPFPQCAANDPVACVAGTNDVGGAQGTKDPGDTTRTISGADVDSFITPDGTASVRPVDLSAQVVEAILDDGTTLPGTGSQVGLFSIANVPQGAFTLHVGDRFLQEDGTETTLDIGQKNLGRPDAAPPTTTTTLTAQLTQMTPWIDGDQIELFAPNANMWIFQADGEATPVLKAGDTAATITFDSLKDEQNQGVSSLIDGTKGDVLYAAHLATHRSPETGVKYLAMTDVAVFPPFTQVDGQPSTQTATFAATAASQQTVRVSVDAPAFEQAAADFLGPAAPYQQTDFLVLAEPGTNTGEIGATADPLTLFLPPGTGNTDTGTMSFAVPLDGAWSTFVDVRGSALRFVTVPGINGQVFVFSSIAFTDTLANVAGSSLAPRLTPAAAPTIDGQGFFDGASGATATPTIAWSAPSTGTPTSYDVGVDHLFSDPNNPNHPLRKQRVVDLVLDGTATSIAIPAGVMTAGERYLVTIVASIDPTADNPVTGATATVTSGVLSVGTDPCAGAVRDPLVGTLALGAGFTAVDAGILNAFMRSVAVVDEGNGVLHGYGIDPFFFPQIAIDDLGAWPFHTTPRELGPLIPADETDPNPFPTQLFDVDADQIVASYGNSDGSGRVLVFDRASNALVSQEPTQSNVGALFDKTTGARVVGAQSFGTINDNTIGVYANAGGIDKILVTFPPGAGFDDAGEAAMIAETSDGVLAVLFVDAGGLEHVVAIAPAQIQAALAQGAPVDASQLPDVDSAGGGAFVGMAGFKDGVVLLRQDASGVAAVERVPLPLVAGALQPGAPVAVLSRVDTCTALAGQQVGGRVLAPIGTDLLVSVEDTAGRRLVRLRAP